MDRQLFVPTPDQEGFQKLEILEDFEDADVDKLESLIYPAVRPSGFNGNQ
jgi:hypothetical protein